MPKDVEQAKQENDDRRRQFLEQHGVKAEEPNPEQGAKPSGEAGSEAASAASGEQPGVAGQEQHTTTANDAAQPPAKPSAPEQSAETEPARPESIPEAEWAEMGPNARRRAVKLVESGNYLRSNLDRERTRAKRASEELDAYKWAFDRAKLDPPGQQQQQPSPQQARPSTAPAQPNGHEAATQAEEQRVYDRLAHEYGPEYARAHADLIREEAERIVAERLGPVMDELKHTSVEFHRSEHERARQEYVGELNRMMPDWEQVANANEFHEWLQASPLGARYAQMLWPQEGQKGAYPQEVASIMEQFKRETGFSAGNNTQPTAPEPSNTPSSPSPGDAAAAQRAKAAAEASQGDNPISMQPQVPMPGQAITRSEFLRRFEEAKNDPQAVRKLRQEVDEAVAKGLYYDDTRGRSASY